MTTDKPSHLVPKLRFPEFREAPGWSRRLIGHYLSESRTKGSGGHKAKKLTVKLWGKGVFEKHESMRGSVNTRYYRRCVGQFIYSKLDFLNQAFGIIPEHLDGFESTVDLPCFNIAPDLNAKFLLEYVQREQFYKTRGEIADGSRKAKRIQVGTFLECPIYSPSLAEQQKIADCLGSLDDLIAAQSRRLEALRRHKQGLMQQLFPRPGETMPRLRFPEFRGAGAWESVCLGDLGTFTGGGTPSKSESTYWQGDIPWVSSSDIIDESITYISITRFITNKAIESSATRLVPQNSILLVSRVGVGKLAVTTNPVCTSQDFTNFTPKKDHLFFLAYYLKANCQALFNLCQGMAIKGFTKESVSKLGIYVPAEKEQQKIADCLGSLDKLIAAENRKLDALRQHKQGLMQQLFPSLEAESR